jgi:hypothetical protein
VTTDDEIASPPNGGFNRATKAGRLRKACFDLLLEHRGNDAIPTKWRCRSARRRSASV